MKSLVAPKSAHNDDFLEVPDYYRAEFINFKKPNP